MVSALEESDAENYDVRGVETGSRYSFGVRLFYPQNVSQLMKSKNHYVLHLNFTALQEDPQLKKH